MPRAVAQSICSTLILLAATAAGAAEGDPLSERSKSYSWGLGLGGISQQQAYAGIDRNNEAIPLIYFENRWVQLLGPFLDIKLPGLKWSEDEQLSFTLKTQLFGFDGYEANDAPILNGMQKRKSGLFSGPSFKWENPIANVFGEWMFDVSGNSKGQRVSLGLEHSFHIGEHLMLTPGVTGIWLDKKYADYYYGVRSTEVRAGRPTYRVDSTMNTKISLRADYFLDPHQAVFLSLGYTALGSEIKDSPLTDRSAETMAFLGYLYRF
jgi:outer membrane protein